MRSFSTLAALALTFTALPNAIASGVGEVEEILSLNPAFGQFPEGVAVDKKGDVFVTVAPTGEVKKIDKKGAVSTHTTFDTSGGFLLGMTVDKDDNVYVALASFNPATEGIHKITPSGQVSLVANVPGFPNDLTIDDKGQNLYVTESIGGAVYKIALASGEAQLWLQDPLLEGDIEVSPVPFPIGVNGIAMDKGSLVLSNSQQPRLVRVAISGGGDPGDPEVILEDPILMGADGVALDVKRDIYVAVNQQNLLLKVSPDGADVDVLADASDGLDFPATVAFGQGPAGKKNLFITNFALFTGETAAPGLLRVDVGVPGRSVP